VALCSTAPAPAGSASQQPVPQKKSKSGIGLFGRVFGGVGDHDDVYHERTGFDYSTVGFALGAEYAITPELRLGLHTGYIYSDLDFDDVSHSDGEIESVYVGLHSSLYIQQFFLHALMGYSHSFFEHNRRIRFASIDRTANADFDGDSFYASLNTGYEFRVSNFRFGPIFSLDYIYQDIGRVKEKGADSLDLTISSRDTHSFKTTLGGRVAYNLKLGSGFVLVPELQAAWVHEYLDDDDHLNTTLRGNPTNPFKVPVPGGASDSFLGGVVLTTLIQDFMSVSLEYNIEAQEDFTSHMGKLNIQLDF
jgi:outer membrane autotransporter protein